MRNADQTCGILLVGSLPLMVVVMCCCWNQYDRRQPYLNRFPVSSSPPPPCWTMKSSPIGSPLWTPRFFPRFVLSLKFRQSDRDDGGNHLRPPPSFRLRRGSAPGGPGGPRVPACERTFLFKTCVQYFNLPLFMGRLALRLSHRCASTAERGSKCISRRKVVLHHGRDQGA